MEDGTFIGSFDVDSSGTLRFLPAVERPELETEFRYGEASRSWIWLVHTDHWLLEFDLLNRQEFSRVRVDVRATRRGTGRPAR